MIRSTLAVAALLASLSLADSAKAQFSLSLGDGSGKNFNLSVGGGSPRGFVQQGPVTQVGGWAPVRRGRRLRGRQVHGGPVMISPSVQPISFHPSGFQPSGWQPVTPVSRVLHSSNGQIGVLGMPTPGGPAIGGSQTFTHVRRDHNGTHTTTRTMHSNGTSSVQRSSVGIPVQAIALMP